MKGRLALITGATAGIGEATAVRLASEGCDLILTGRRTERLERLRARLEDRVRVTTLAFDVTKYSACENALKTLGNEIERVDILVNNAGLAAGVDPMTTAKIEDWDLMVDTNIKGLLYLTRLLIPHMTRRGSGDIVNLGSVAGRWTYPGGGVYCATKAAVRALTEGLRLDLKGTGIRATNISPGMVETDFSVTRLGSKEAADKVYVGMTPLTAADIADAIAWCLSRPAHVNIQEMLVFPVDQPGVGIVHRKT